MDENKWIGLIEKVQMIYNRLEDEESRELFRQRLNYTCSNSKDDFCDWIVNRYQDFYCKEIDLYEQKNGNSPGYVIFGAGNEGRQVNKVLKVCNIKVSAWCDNNSALWGKKIDGIKVITPGELIEDYGKNTVIIAVKNFETVIYRQLLGMNFSREYILLSKNERLLAFRGKQYFDLFEHEQGKKEVFVDAGCFDGATTSEFINWCGGEYERIIAFEPDQYCFRRCKKNIDQLNDERIQLIEKATWDKRENLKFFINGRGSSKIEDAGSVSVDTISIDEVLNGKEATFIKMDVEGSENKSLIGAINTIREYKPKLAISMYHKNEDLYELADTILSIRNDYKLYIRHYSSYMYETILYAI